MPDAPRPPVRDRARLIGPVTAVAALLSAAWLSWTPCGDDAHPDHHDLFTLGPIVQPAPPPDDRSWPAPARTARARTQCPA